jgi:hypothetical protein
MANSHRNFYVDFILNWWTKLAVFLLFLTYICLSVWGIARMEQGLDYEKLLLSTDPLVGRQSK